MLKKKIIKSTLSLLFVGFITNILSTLGRIVTARIIGQESMGIYMLVNPTAVFFIKYLRTLGFDVTNDIFAENAWYFRNALVRANYTNLQKGVHETTEYLEAFLRNLLLGEENKILSLLPSFLCAGMCHIYIYI